MNSPPLNIYCAVKGTERIKLCSKRSWLCIFLMAVSSSSRSILLPHSPTTLLKILICQFLSETKPNSVLCSTSYIISGSFPQIFIKKSQILPPLQPQTLPQWFLITQIIITDFINSQVIISFLPNPGNLCLHSFCY